jgi:hypothetical protein
MGRTQEKVEIVLMNERIRELAIQAYVAAGHDRNHELFNALLDESAEFHEKFAELIVLEMCTVLDKEQWNIGRDWICDDGMRIIPKVKEHFGVE